LFQVPSLQMTIRFILYNLSKYRPGKSNFKMQRSDQSLGMLSRGLPSPGVFYLCTAAGI